MFLRQRCFWKLNMDDSLHIDCSIFNSTFSIYQNYNTFYSCGFVCVFFFMNLSLSDVDVSNRLSPMRNITACTLQHQWLKSIVSKHLRISLPLSPFLLLCGSTSLAERLVLFQFTTLTLRTLHRLFFVLEVHVIFEKIMRILLFPRKKRAQWIYPPFCPLVHVYKG